MNDDGALFDPTAYGEAIADVFDRPSLIEPGVASPAAEPTDVVDFLVARAGAGPVLELGVGTGRVAIPLAARGVSVHGVDVSQRMLDRLAAKPGGPSVTTYLGDMAELASPGSIAFPGTFTLVYAVMSSLYGVVEAEAQIRCVAAVASVLVPGGLFVVEGFVPDVARYRDRGQGSWVREVGPAGVALTAAVHDPVRQTITAQQVAITEAGVRLYPSQVRYLWPSEQDLICRLAGLRLVSRAGGWDGQPFTAASTYQVSVYTVG